MSVLVFTESSNGTFKKSTLEAVSYGKSVANQMNTELVAISVNNANTEELFTYGANKIVAINNDALNAFNAQLMADVLKQAAQKEQANVIVVESSANGLYLAPMLSATLEAGYASNVIAEPSAIEPFTVKRKSFSNKAFNNTQINTPIKVIGLAKNTVGLIENPTDGVVEAFSPELGTSTISSQSVDQTTGKVTIADADIVVSGGRGLKGPENWGIIEDLANVLGAATACSKPVSDLGWRPHSEHVGQTGKPVASNLYIAVGISGAIQHLAGVNSSKVKVVINTDPEAPFFKAADYGIVGDAFEVVPKLIEKLQEFKESNT